MNAHGLNWYCLCVQPQREYVAEHVLRQLGIVAFVPTEMKHLRNPRRRRRQNFKPKKRAYPMFGSRYLFVGYQDLLPAFELSQIHLITGFVAIDGRPAVFPAEAIEHLARISKNVIHRRSTPNPHQAFVAGDRVEVMAGPFNGHVVEIGKVRGNLASFCLELFGKVHAVELPLECLSAV